MPQFIVTMTCKVRKQVVCVAEHEQLVWERPFDFAESEEELEQLDWEIEKVEDDK